MLEKIKSLKKKFWQVWFKSLKKSKLRMNLTYECGGHVWYEKILLEHLGQHSHYFRYFFVEDYSVLQNILDSLEVPSINVFTKGERDEYSERIFYTDEFAVKLTLEKGGIRYASVLEDMLDDDDPAHYNKKVFIDYKDEKTFKKYHELFLSKIKFRDSLKEHVGKINVLMQDDKGRLSLTAIPIQNPIILYENYSDNFGEKVDK